MGAMGAIAPTAKKLWRRCPQVAPQEFCNVIFETVKCIVKIRIYQYASDKSCADFSLKCIKSVWRPGFARTRWEGAYTLFQILPQLDLRAGAGTRERERGKRQEGGDKGRMEWGEATEESGRRMKAEISQVRPKALPITQNASEILGEGVGKNKEVGDNV